MALSDPSAMIVIQVSKSYGKNENRVQALTGVDLSASQGEFIAIVGTSGSGKTTLLNLIGGLESPDQGQIIIRDRDIAQLSRRALTIFRRRNIGFVFQNYSLMPVLNVYDNVALPVTFDKGKRVDHAYIHRLLEDLGLWDKRTRYPNELSGGQQQRVAIARALASDAKVILADEPTGNLDTENGKVVIDMLKKLVKDENYCVIVVTHDPGIAEQADIVYKMQDGRLAVEC